MKGHRTNLFNYRRSGIATDECSCAYKTKDTEEGKGLHFPTRQKVCQWVHCEADSAVTALFPEQHTEYSFFHFVWGQVTPMLEIMAPRSGGFSKRFAVALCSYRPRQDPLQEMRLSSSFLIDYYDWLSYHALGLDVQASKEQAGLAHDDSGEGGFVRDDIGRQAPVDVPEPGRVAYCSPGARVMFEAVQEAVTDAQEELEASGKEMSPYFQEKLDYWDTDLCHFANATMREVQFCTSLSLLPGAGAAHRRVAWTPEETVYALHLWHRQLRWHHAIIQYSGESGHPPSTSARSSGSSACTQTEQHAARLLHEPALRQEVGSGKLRDRLKNKMSREGLLDAVHLLVSKGIVDAPGISKASPSNKARFTVKKRSWSELSEHEGAVELLKRLRVNRDCFD